MSESRMRRDLKRFGVEFLCLLMLLYGDPLQAISQAGATSARLEVTENVEPEDVRLTTRDGRIFELGLADGVTRLEDLNGNHLTITPAGITHSSGQGIEFERDAEGRIERIVDPRGESLVYAYGAGGDLVSVTDQGGNATTFTYGLNHYLEEIEDARGVTPIRNEYDADGRLARHVDAFGKVIEVDHRASRRRTLKAGWWRRRSRCRSRGR